MESIAPILRMTDYDLAKEFYVEALGFSIDFQWPHQSDGPVFLGLSRGPLRLWLSEHPDDCKLGGAISIAVDNVDQWYARLMAAGLHIQREPETQPWGTREMYLQDPFTNGITIASPVPTLQTN